MWQHAPAWFQVSEGAAAHKPQASITQHCWCIPWAPSAYAWFRCGLLSLPATMQKLHSGAQQQLANAAGGCCILLYCFFARQRPPAAGAWRGFCCVEHVGMCAGQAVWWFTVCIHALVMCGCPAALCWPARTVLCLAGCLWGLGWKRGEGSRQPLCQWNQHLVALRAHLLAHQLLGCI
jgi:hypothetical protein